MEGEQFSASNRDVVMPTFQFQSPGYCQKSFPELDKKYSGYWAVDPMYKITLIYIIFNSEAYDFPTKTKEQRWPM